MYHSLRIMGASLVALCLVATASAQQSTKNYRYDALGRLIEIDEQGGSNDTDTRSYFYDAAGNRVQVGTTDLDYRSGGSALAADAIVAWSDNGGLGYYYQIHARGLLASGTQAFADRTINSQADGQQDLSGIAADQSGNFVTVWQDDLDINGYYQILMRGFNADGKQRFSQRTVNSIGAGQQLKPQIAMADDGSFVVVWEDDADGNGHFEIEMRGFSANGSESFAQTTVNTPGDGRVEPQIAMAGDGRFVVVWQDDVDKNGYSQILMRGFNANGTERFSQRTVNSIGADQQLKPQIAMADNADFAVVWEDDADGNSHHEIEMRGFNANGSEKFAQRTVNLAGDGRLNPEVGMADDGSLVVVWQDDADKNGYHQVLMRGFNANGIERFSQRTVNSVAAGQQTMPHIGMLSSGGFMVVWEDDANDDGSSEVFGRGFNANGLQTFADFTINSASDGNQKQPVIAVKR